MARRDPVAGLLRTFRAEQISTPIADAHTVELSANPREAAAELVSLRFDQAPVRNQGHIWGWVLTERLATAAKVKSVLQSLEVSAIVSAEASIADVLDRLGEQGLVFTVDERGIAGFITPSDLDRHAARAQFYLLIAGLEMVLADIVQRTIPEEIVIAAIHDELLERWTSASDKNTETRAVEYLYIKDLAILFLGSAAGTQLPPVLRNTMTELCQLRPAVMHPTRPLIGARTPGELASLASRGEELLVGLDDLLQAAEVSDEQKFRPATPG
jgi:hypothetical protein